jgi:hypothetical protein
VRVLNRKALLLPALVVAGILASVPVSAGANGIREPAQSLANAFAFLAVQQEPKNIAPPLGSSENSSVACTLLSSSVIKSVQGEPLKQSKGSQAQNESMIISQCFYSLPTFSNSISLTLNLPLSGNASRTGPRYLWKKWFHADTSDNQEPNPDFDSPQPKEEGAEEKSAPPVPVSGLGEEAFWVRRFVGTLYVLKGDTVLRISIGGKQDDAARLRKAQLLAKSALENLP